MNLSLKIADTKEMKKIADEIVVSHHSYVASARTVGRCLKYLIYDEDLVVGTFWLGSGFKPTPKSILNHLGIGQKEFDKVFNSVADNKRFCMSVQIPNAGSQILRMVRNRAKKDWFEKYGDDLTHIVTTIGGGKTGAVYKADNWKLIGETAGLSTDRKSVSMKWDDEEGIKSKYVKPDGLNKKLIFITDRI